MIDEINNWKAKFDVIINTAACAKLDRESIVNSFVKHLGESERDTIAQRVNEIYDNQSPENDDKIIANYTAAIEQLEKENNE